MVISEENRLTNFIINVFRGISTLKRVLIEPIIQLEQQTKKKKEGKESNPDLLCYLINEGQNLYQIYEYKHRISFFEKDVAKFLDQYQKYKKINYQVLDRAVIPIDELAKFATNYVFYNTPVAIIDQFLDSSIFNDETEIDYYNVENSNRIIRRHQKANDATNSIFINELVHSSGKNSLWESRIVPFIPRDLRGINGLGGSSDNVSVDIKTSIDIILANLFTFILYRKIRELPSEFTISEFFEFLYSNLLNILVVFTKEAQKSMERKLVLFLDLLIKIANQEEKEILRKSAGTTSKYLIRVKNTGSLHKRLRDLQEKMFRLIESERKQRKLDEFIES